MGSAGSSGRARAASRSGALAAINPARALGPDVALLDFTSYWLYVIGPLAGAALAVPVARVLRGPARAQEALSAMGNPAAAD